jgi:hypothetical protein
MMIFVEALKMLYSVDKVMVILVADEQQRIVP